jgi:hypothetical protein
VTRKIASFSVSVLCLAAASSLLQANQAHGPVESLDWLAGRWCMSSANRLVEEAWLP